MKINEKEHKKLQKQMCGAINDAVNRCDLLGTLVLLIESEKEFFKNQ